MKTLKEIDAKRGEAEKIMENPNGNNADYNFAYGVQVALEWVAYSGDDPFEEYQKIVPPLAG